MSFQVVGKLFAISDLISETTTNKKDHKMEEKNIEQAEKHLKEAEAVLKIAKDAMFAAEHKIDEALQEKWDFEDTGEKIAGKVPKKIGQVKEVLGK
jgi:septum formation inhibitor MinC